MAFITIEDFSGKGECIVFSKTYDRFFHHIHPESMVMVIGKADISGETLKVLADEIYPMDSVREKFTKSIILSFHVNDVQENAIVELRKVMEKHKGNCRCYIDVVDADQKKPSRFQTLKFAVEASDEFLTEVKKILGPNSVRISQKT